MFHRASSESAAKVDVDGGGNSRSNTDEQQRIGAIKSRVGTVLKGCVSNDMSDTTTTPIGSNNSTDIPNVRHWQLPPKSRGQSSLSSGSRLQPNNNQYPQATTSTSTTNLNNINNQKEDTTKSHQNNNSLSNRARSHLSSSQIIARTNSSYAANNQNLDELHLDGSNILHQDHNRLGQHQHSTPLTNYRPLSHLKHSQYHHNLHNNITMSLAAQLASNASNTVAPTTEVIANMPKMSEKIPTTSTTSPSSTSSALSTTRLNNERGSSSSNNPNQRLQQPQSRHKTTTISSKSFEKSDAINKTSDENRHQQQQSDLEQDEQLDTDEALAVIKQELSQIGTSPDDLDEADIEALGSLEQNLPIELSFLIKQQAVCMARINYLTRQVKELKETKQQNHGNSTNYQSQTTQQLYKQQPQPVATNCTGANSTHQHHYHHQPQQQQQQQQHQLPFPHPPLQHHHHHHHQVASQFERAYQYPGRLSGQQQQQQQQLQHQLLTASQPMHVKNGNLILSDDSGGEYSRATISDDDELSSLLDQIAKTVRSERNPSNQSAILNSSAGIGNCASGIGLMPSHSSTIQPITTTALGSAFSSVMNHQQQYAIINPGQFHQQAVPIFVMGQPVAMQTTAPHASSISSNVLPGVHFQPEPRYNQYYEEMYAPMHQQHRSIAALGTMRPPNHQTHHLINQQQHPHHQFDSSISAIDQLVSQREKRQIKSQLKSADNWLKMRSSTMCNSVENQSSSASNIVQIGMIPNDCADENLKDNPTERTQQHISTTTAASASSSTTAMNNKDNMGNQ